MADIPSFWNQVGRRLCFRVNATAWAEWFSPRFFLLSAVGAVVLYAFRRLGVEALWVNLAVLLCALALAYWAYVQKKREFFQRREAFAFLDYHCKLQSSLSAALEGKASWPVERSPGSVLRWKSPGIFLWIPLGVALFVSAGLLPLPAAATGSGRWEKPPAVATMEQWIAELNRMEAVKKEDVTKMEEKLDELLSRSEEEMYSHAALEAADSLEEQMKQDIKSFASNLNQLRQALDPAAGSELKLEGAPVVDSEALKKALEAMKDQNLQLSPNLGNKENAEGQGGQDSVSELSADQISSLSPEQLQALRDDLGDVASQLENLDIEGMQSSLGKGEGGKGEGPGQGAPTRGRGDAPLSLGKEAEDLQLEKEKLARDPNSKVTLGSKVGEESGVHEAEDAAGSSPGASGGVGNASSGGQATWADQYTPQEREALKDFFK